MQTSYQRATFTGSIVEALLMLSPKESLVRGESRAADLEVFISAEWGQLQRAEVYKESG